MLVIRDSQLAALRRPALAEGMVQALAAAGWAATFDEVAGELLLSDAAWAVTRVGFDERGFACRVTSAEGRVWRVDVDPDGRPLRLTDPDSGWLALRYAATGRLAAVSRGLVDVRRYDWAADGRLAQVAHADGSTTRYAAAQPDGTRVVGDRRGGVRSVTHDGRGRLVAAQDANGNRTRHEHDVGGRRSAVVRPDGSRETYAYDDSGQLRQVADAAGLFVSLDHDAGGRVTAARYGDGTTVRVERDAAGRPAVVVVTDGPSADSPAAAADGPPSPAAGATGPTGPTGAAARPERRVTRTYDEAGRLSVDDGGHGGAQGAGPVRLAYDPAGRLESVEWPPDGDPATFPAPTRSHFRYDRDGRLAGVVDWAGGEHRFVHAPNDAGMTVWHPNGLVTTASFGDGGRPRYADTRRRDARADDPPVFTVGYQFDAEGRLRLLRDSTFDARSYAYDAEGQLTSVQWAAGHAETFAYDPAGHRAKVGPVAVRADACGRLVAHGPVELSYDARGNLVALAGPGVNWRYRYDGRGLLVRATNRADGVRLEFEYDAVGRRTLKRAHGTVARFVWAGDHLVREIVETVAGGRSVRDYLYHPGTHVPLAARIDGVVYCYHCDHLGAPRRLTGPAGDVAWAADYGAFGRARPAVMAIDQPWRLPGQYHDAESRLHSTRTRYYAPDLGRYVTPNPPGPGVEPNDYRYGGNDPVNQADPLGLGSAAGAAAALGQVASPVGLGASGVATNGPRADAAAAVAAAVALRLNESLDGEQFRPPGTPPDPVREANAQALADLPAMLCPTLASGWQRLAEMPGHAGV